MDTMEATPCDTKRQDAFKVRLPDTYGGERDAIKITNWTFAVFQYMSLADIPEQKQVLFASTLLTDEALSWFRYQFRDSTIDTNPILANWPLFQSALREYFEPPNNQRRLRDFWAQAQQNTTVSQYVAQLKDIALQLPTITAEEFLDKFIRGLKPRTRSEVELRDPQNIKEAIRAADRFDAILGSRQSSRPSHNLQYHRPQYQVPYNQTTQHQRPRYQAPQNQAPQYQGHQSQGYQPMQLGSTNLTRLTPQDRECLRQQGLCFKCRKPGHMARDCPTRQISAGFLEVSSLDSNNDIPTYLYPIGNRLPTNAYHFKSEPPEEYPEIEYPVLERPEREHPDLMLTKTEEEDHQQPKPQEMIDTIKENQVNLATTTPKNLARAVPSCRPETYPPPSMLVQLNGHTARVLLDSGCGTMILARNFSNKHNIPTKEATPVEMQWISNQKSEKVHLQTDAVTVEIKGQTFSKTFYVMDLDHYDAILGQPFIAQHAEQLQLISKLIPQSTASVIGRKAMKRLLKQNTDHELTIAFVNCQSGEVTNTEEHPLLREFQDVFSEHLPTGLPPQREIVHQIETFPGAEPPFRSTYRLAQPELQELRRQLDELLAQGKIQPSISPYGAPVIFIKKKDGSLRMCVDYRLLNNQTVKNRLALPRIDELLDRLHSAKVFSKLDLTSGYHQIAIRTEDIPKTAFRTRYGHYEYKVLPFGLTNAPATFQRLMNDIFQDVVDDFVVVYLDDILVYSENPQQHEEHLRKVLDRLRQHSLKAKPSKCSFFQEEVEYLGHRVGYGKLRPTEDLTKAIHQFPVPHTTKQLQSFLGLANYYRRFVPNFSSIAAPLTALTGKTRFIWNDTAQKTFEHLKHLLTSTPCLLIPNPNKPFTVETDASDTGIGAVLTQDGHPVAFESAKFTEAEKRYPVHDKELAAVIHACRKWRPFLLGTAFTVLTDHRSLTHFFQQPSLNSRQQRWQEFLVDYNINFQYKPGKENQAADALSRIPVITTQIMIHASIDERKLREEYQNDDLAEDIFNKVKSNADSQWMAKDELLYFVPTQFDEPRLYLPAGEIRVWAIHKAHDHTTAGHRGITKTYARLARQHYWPRMLQDVQRHIRYCDACQRTKASRQSPPGLLMPLPIPSRPWESVGMDFLGPVPVAETGESYILVVVDRFSKMAHFFPLKKGFRQEDVADLFLEQIVRLHGLPSSIVSDRDSRFTSPFWKALTKSLQIELKMSTAAHPQTDGQAEATVKIVQNLIIPYTIEGHDWVRILPSLEFAYNSSQQSATGMSPFLLNYGYEPRDVLTTTKSRHITVHQRLEYIQDLHTMAKDQLLDSQITAERYANRFRSAPPKYEEGQLVLLKKLKRTKFQPLTDGPYTIKAVGRNTVTLDFPPGSQAYPVVNVSRVQPYFGESLQRAFTPPPPPPDPVPPPGTRIRISSPPPVVETTTVRRISPRLAQQTPEVSDS